MNCQEFRRQAGADPRGLDADALSHRDACPRCAEHLRQLLAMDALLLKALQVPVAPPEARDVVVPLASQARRGVATHAGRRRWYSLAASLVGGVLLGTLLWVTNPRVSLARDVLAHARGEPQSLVAGAPALDPAQVSAVLAKNGLRLRASMGRISYARTCPFRGHEIPHLVVQTEHGPVTVLVLRDEHVGRAIPLHEDGFVGTIAPAGPGALAVIGVSPEQARDVLAQVQGVIEWLPR